MPARHSGSTFRPADAIAASTCSCNEAGSSRSGDANFSDFIEAESHRRMRNRGDELSRIGGLRRFQNLLGGPFFDDASALHYDHVIAQKLYDVQIMTDKEIVHA